MRYLAVACDFDGTIASEGSVDRRTIELLERVKQSGRKIVLVTGRELDDLWCVFSELSVFDAVVAENGALLYRPATRDKRCLAKPPPPRFVAMLKERGVAPLSVGEVIVATLQPHAATALEVISELGIEFQVIFNKGAAMVLPSGINKAVGLRAALEEAGLSEHDCVGVGDAENDHSFLDICQCSVAVADAVPELKNHVDFVTSGPNGAGVRELLNRLLADDLASLECGRHRRSSPARA